LGKKQKKYLGRNEPPRGKREPLVWQTEDLADQRAGKPQVGGILETVFGSLAFFPAKRRGKIEKNGFSVPCF
jgi:hypothetical protein